MGLFDRLMQPQAPRRNLMDTQMVRRPSESYLRQDYPTVYGALGGLLGTAPDEMAGSVLDPNTAAVRRGAEYGFPVGTALGMLPAARFTKGLPVGMGIKDVSKKNIDVSLNNLSNFLSAKSEFGQVGGTIRPADKFSDKPYLQINYAEVEKESRGMGKGKELYQSLIDDAQARGLRVFSDSTVEKPAVNVYKSLGKKDYELRDMTKGSLEDGSVYGAGAKNPAFEILPRQSPYPQQAALDLAQQRAALPVSKSLLMSIPSGLTRTEQANLIKNHAENFAAKAKEMGLSASVEHSGSKAGPSSYVTVLDPITGAKFESPFRFSGHSKGPKENQFVYNVGDDFSNELGALEKMALSIPKAERDAIQSARQAKMIKDLALQEKERIFSQGRPAVQSAMQEANLQQTPYTKAFSNSGKYIGANELDYPSNPMYTDPLGYSIR